MVFIDEPAAGLFHADPGSGNAGLAEVGVFVFMDQKQHVVVPRQVFDCHEGHDVLGVPVDAAGQGVFYFIGPFQPLGVVAGIIGQRYGIAPAVDGDAGTAVGHALYGLGGIISRRLPAQGYGDEEGHDQVEGDANRRQDGDEALVTAQVGGEGDGNGNHVRERIGHVFRSHALVKDKDDDSPGRKKLFFYGQGISHAAQAGKASCSQTSSQLVNWFIFLCGQRQREYPGKEAQQEHGRIVIPHVIPGMLRHGSPQDVVDADELADEITAVHHVHGYVPQAGDDKEQQQPRPQLDMQEYGFEISPPQQKQDDNQPRQDEAYWPLGQDGQGGAGVGAVVQTRPPFAVGKVKQHERRRKEDEQGHVRNDGVGKVEIFQRRHENQGCDEARLFVVQARRETIGHDDADEAEDGREKAGGEFRRAEQGKGGHELPVKQDGLVVPVIAENAR